jgi:CRP/FNR family transcriptional regulator, cyclic AMP receptor protein
MGAEDSQPERFSKEFPKGTVLFSEGDPGREMFVIRKGRVTISKLSREVETVLVTLGPGEFFGEMSILNQKPRSATATVAEDARLLVLDPRTFETMLRANGEIALRMIQKLADRLAEADAQIENLLLQDASARLLHLMAHALESRGRPEAGGVFVALPIADVPGQLGLRPEQVKSALQKLARAGIATFEAEGFRVPDPAKLRDFEQFLAMQEKLGDPA